MDAEIEHCPSGCHEHTVQTWTDISSGDFFAPNHDYPSHVRLILKVTDSDGQSDTDSVDSIPADRHRRRRFRSLAGFP